MNFHRINSLVIANYDPNCSSTVEKSNVIRIGSIPAFYSIKSSDIYFLNSSTTTL